MWRGIARAEDLQGNTVTAESARSVAFALRATAARLRDVSAEYQNQNRFATLHNKQPGGKFANLELFDLFLALHSLLVEACSARDYLARFIAQRIIGINKVDSMTKLLDRLKNNHQSGIVIDALREASEKGGSGSWLAQLGQYRNMIVHQAPIAGINESRFLSLDNIPLGKSTFLAVRYRIPQDPGDVANSHDVDALVHFRQLLLRLFDFARLIGSHSGVTPATTTIHEADLLPLPIEP